MPKSCRSRTGGASTIAADQLGALGFGSSAPASGAGFVWVGGYSGEASSVRINRSAASNSIQVFAGR
jgi:hypothetical protein